MPSFSKQITLEDIFLHSKYASEHFNGFFSDIPEKIPQMLSDYLGFEWKPKDYCWNQEKNYLLFWIEKEAIYRRSFKASYYVLNIFTNEISPICSEKILHTTFSPSGHQIAYVHNNNLFVYDIISQKSQAITTDGCWNNIINGNCDWVYEEEFGFSQAYQWSPDSSMIAYYRFDESIVKEYTFPIYNDNYNDYYTYKYPKAGQENATVTIHCYDLKAEKKITFAQKSDGGYIPKILWSAENQLAIFHLNRWQNELNVWMNDIHQNTFYLFYSESNSRYIDFTDDWYFLSENRLLFTHEKNGFRNISIKQGKKSETAITLNNYDLIRILKIDKEKNIIFFQAAFPTAMERQLFAVHLSGKQYQLTNENGWNEIFFTEEAKHVWIENSNIREPAICKQYELHYDDKEQPILCEQKTVIDNRKLKNRLEELDLSIPGFLSIPKSDSEYLNAWMLKPKHFDEQKQYPVLFCNYGGPGSQMVVNQFGAVSMWHHYLSQQGLIIVCVDNTGTGGRGEDFKKKTYLQLGKYEIEDQIIAANYMRNLPYVNKEQIGHWGWSFGGFMSCLAISKGAAIFKFAVAIAPVTSWLYYDTIYTERYMRTPNENPDGYSDNTPFASLENIKGELFLIHGSADDNVHVQHSMQLSKRLIEKNIPFDMFLYPDKNHRINGGNTSIHLWEKVSKWLLKKTS